MHSKLVDLSSSSPFSPPLSPLRIVRDSPCHNPTVCHSLRNDSPIPNLNEEKTVKAKTKRKMERQQAREEAQREYDDRLLSLRSLHGLPMKLLILDLNKVLLYRIKGCDKFIPRPSALEFLRAMAQRFVLGVWTSMKRHSGHRVLQELFEQNDIPLLFVWFQPKCVAEYTEDRVVFHQQHQQQQQQQQQQQHLKPAAVPEDDQDKVDSGDEHEHEHGREEETMNTNQKRTPFWKHAKELKRQKKLQQLLTGIVGGGVSIATATANPSSNDIVMNAKPIFHKPLKHVWNVFRVFSETNTVSSFPPFCCFKCVIYIYVCVIVAGVARRHGGEVCLEQGVQLHSPESFRIGHFRSGIFACV
jgi:hypothetical protein